ncbi:MAG TPA: prephenate dehydrogenase/arogenate dehydrogenase family protein [Actinomycetota bacterium]|nr:prephenate dehydrogenase/arogenate dehydrogenase family protein [Actinomycetota bacterium]
MTSADRVAVVGTGLIGTSIAMAAARVGDVVRGFDTDADALAVAAERSGLAPAPSLTECVAGATVVVVSTPIPSVPGVVGETLRLAPEPVVTDVASVKSHVMSEVRRAAGSDDLSRYVGGHPMGGSERSGPDHASASVLDGIVWALDARAEPKALERVEAFVAKLGARPVRLDAERHDRLVAMVSHLPQVASTALMGLAATEEAGEPELLLLAAGGFRDLTRLAASSPHLWSDILVANGDAIGRAISLYVERLTRLREMVEAGDAGEVERAFGEAKDARLSLAAKPQVKAGVAVLQVPVPDRPGVLAEVTAAMSEAGVNIEDLQIVHSPEGGRGTVHMTVAAAAAADAERALRDHWFEPIRLA